VTFLDAYALIAFLIGGPSSAAVRALLREGDAAITTANLVEVLDVSERRYGIPVARSIEFLEPLFGGPLATVALDLRIAVRAGELRARHYDRVQTPLSLGDSILLASAGPTDRVVTPDAAVLAVAATLGVATVALASEG
jgi:predicted nucleic acid-binding protein